MATTKHSARREQLQQALAHERARCKVALKQIEEARARMAGPRIQMATGYETLRECRTRIRQIRRELAALR